MCVKEKIYVGLRTICSFRPTGWAGNVPPVDKGGCWRSKTYDNNSAKAWRWEKEVCYCKVFILYVK